MSKGNRYHESVWICLRELYEASPKASVNVIREELANMLGIDVPSESAIVRRSKKEKWEKLSKRQCNFSSKTLQKKMQKKYSENLAESIVTKDIHGSLEKVKNKGVSVSRVGIERVFQKRAFLERKTAKVLLEHRKRAFVVGQYFDVSVSNFIELDYRLNNFKEYWRTEPPEFENVEYNDAFAMVCAQHSSAMRTLGLFESMNISVEKLARVDFVLYGINPDDTREPESEKRIVDLESEEDAEYYALQERLALEEQVKIAERMSKLQSGVFEEMVRLEAMKKAAEHNLNEEVEDGEFNEIN